MFTFTPRLPIAAITDEFSPVLSEAIPVMQEIGMTGAELRVINGSNILDLEDDDLKRAKEQLDSASLPVISIASPILKCVLPGGPDLDRRFQQDAFASKHTYNDQPRLAERALRIATFFGARVLRVFSYWRTVEPSRCEDAIASALSELARLVSGEDVMIALENEHACNVATGAEAARMLSLVHSPNVKLVWDPANALAAGEQPFPDGYSVLPKDRIAHVHAKDCHMEGTTPIWAPLGTRDVPWKDQIAALNADGYHGFLSLETHWPGPGGNKLEASRICGWNLRALAS